MMCRAFALLLLAASGLNAIRVSSEEGAELALEEGSAEDSSEENEVRKKVMEMLAENDEPAPGGGHCCCKNEPCRAEAIDRETGEATYSPNQNMCCKLKDKPCSHWLNWLSAYKTAPPTPDFCNRNAPQDKRFVPAAIPQDPDHVIPPADSYKAGSPGHLIHNYCNFSGHVDSGEDGSVSDEAKHKIVQQIIQQLSENSIDQMAKSMFSIYMCMRWVPTIEFQDMALSEITNEQISTEKSVLQHYQDFTFMPLKCTPNFAVYDDRNLNQTFFENFELEMNAHKTWYVNEAESVIAARLRKISEARQGNRPEEVAELSRLFDLQVVRNRSTTCTLANNGNILINTMTVTAEEFLEDCAAAVWWETKLSDWHRSMPFSTFMTPTDLAKDAKPAPNEQILLCFGKRIAGEMHRRAAGTHLMTDQSTVGCHGFYEFAEAARMIDRITKLWSPPTCELAAMTLDFKVKILEMMVDMNDRLFDAMPSLIMEEQTGFANMDGSRMEAAGGLGVVAGFWKAIVDRFSFFQTKAARLGSLLGGTTVKWAVCPLNTITNQTDMTFLDDHLGSEDLVSAWYSKIASARHTGEVDLLPGEKCTDGVPGLAASANAQRCSLGTMRENMPEPYQSESFICPVLPLLPAKSQLAVLEKKVDKCTLHMNLAQQMQQNWYFRGHTPSQKQNNATSNVPGMDFQASKIMSWRSTPDSKFNIYRDFVKIGLGCSEAARTATPRWCDKPVILNDGLSDRNLLTNLPLPQGEGISNELSSERFLQGLWRSFKGIERWTRRLKTEWAGRAGTRYNKLYARSFDEVEAGDLLHSISFQEHLGDSGGDSSGNHQYDRYVALVPCVGFEPEREFKLKYEWTEHGMQLIRKALADWNTGDAISNAKAFAVDLRAEAVLKMSSETSAWLEYSTHLRAYGIPDEIPDWKKTDNPVMTSLSGALDPRLAANIRATDMRGFQAIFLCGPRTRVHDLELFPTSAPGTESFNQCVKSGVETNRALREQNPGQSVLPDEVVVRMTIQEFDTCYKDIDSSMVQLANETENHVYKNFLDGVDGCASLDRSQLPHLLRSIVGDQKYRGMLLGKGVPGDTLQEVLMDPEDVMNEAGIE